MEQELHRVMEDKEEKSKTLQSEIEHHNLTVEPLTEVKGQISRKSTYRTASLLLTKDLLDNVSSSYHQERRGVHDYLGIHLVLKEVRNIKRKCLGKTKAISLS